MKNVLVLGSTGMAGHVITSYLSKNDGIKIFNLSHRKKLNNYTTTMDVMDINKFNNFLNTLQLDFIINCTGILNKVAEDFKEKAAFVNGFLPHFLENKYKDTNTRIIHISTDCVFSGNQGNYLESSFKDGDSFYARSKALGEIVNQKDLTFRTSIIGPDLSIEGIGLLNWYMKSSGEINGYTNHIWTGITTIELAKAVEKAIFTELTGLYHLVPKDKISKYELLQLFNDKFHRKDLNINKYESDFIDKSLINSRQDFCYEVQGYFQMIEDMKNWIYAHRDFYKHYSL